MEMTIQIVDVNCPVCGSDRTRSKWHDERGWFYICDNIMDAEHVILAENPNLGGTFREVDLVKEWESVRDDDRPIRVFYWNPEAKIICHCLNGKFVERLYDIESLEGNDNVQ